MFTVEPAAGRWWRPARACQCRLMHPATETRSRWNETYLNQRGCFNVKHMTHEDVHFHNSFHVVYSMRRNRRYSYLFNSQVFWHWHFFSNMLLEGVLLNEIAGEVIVIGCSQLLYRVMTILSNYRIEHRNIELRTQLTMCSACMMHACGEDSMSSRSSSGSAITSSGSAADFSSWTDCHS